MEVNLRFSLVSNSHVAASNIEINKSKQSSEIGTIKDRRLGEVNNVECDTCKLTKNTGCNGHVGKIPIRDNVYIHPSLTTELKNVLNMFCYGCRMLRNQSKVVRALETKDKDTLKDLKDLKKSKCENQFCEEKYGQFKFIDSKFYVKKDNINIECDNKILYNMVKSIENISFSIFSLRNSSDCFIYGYLAAPSNTIRQPHSYDGQETNIITNKYNKIISDITKRDANIQMSISELDNDKSIKPYKKNNVKSVTMSDLAGEYEKKGLLRGNVITRRKENSARCVVSQGIDLNIGEVGTPDKVLSVLTDAIYFSKFSKSFVKDIIFNKNFVYLVKKKSINNCERYQLFSFKKEKTFEKFDISLQYGDFIEIPKESGSYIIRVRQPTLYKYNITADMVIENKNNEDTLRTNTSSITVRGEDYDGDEESAFNPISKISQFEQSITMSSRSIIKNNSLGVLVYGLIQDQIIALHILSKTDNISLSECILLLGKYSCLIDDIKKTTYSGKELISLFFPNRIFIPGVIEKGMLVKNITSKEVTSMSSDSIANHLSQLINEEFAINIIDAFSYLSRRYLSYYGFSVTPKDVFLNNTEINEINAKIQEWVNLYTDMLDRYFKDVENDKIKILPQSQFEKIIFSNLNGIQRLAVDQIRKLFTNIEKNSVITMESANFKINKGELLTNYALLGQQGKAKSQHRIMGRSIPQQLPKTLCPESFGYITNGLLYGLTPEDYFIQIKDTSLPNIAAITVKTATTGHTGRQVVKYMESLVVNDQIGVDSYDEIILPAANFLKISGGDICKVDILKPGDYDYEWKDLISTTFNKFKKFLIIDNYTAVIKKLDFFMDIDKEIKSFETKNNKTISNGDERIVNFIDYIIKNYFFYTVDDTWFKYCMLTHLDPNRLKVYGLSLTSDLMEYITAKIFSRLETSLSPGTPVGIEYGTNLQENFTQQSLSSFHTTDKRGQQIKKLGFEEFKKYVDLVKNKYQSVTLISVHKRKLEYIKNQIEFVSLGDLHPEINILKKDNNLLDFSITVDKTYLEIKKLSLCQLSSMITSFLEHRILFDHPKINIDVKGSSIIFEIGVELFEPYERKFHYLMLALKDGIYKGKLFNSDISINDIKMYDDDLNEIDGYELKIVLDEIKILSNFDTREVLVDTNDIQTISEIKGIELAESELTDKILDTFGDKTYRLFNSVKLLVKMMCKDSKITNIKRLKDKDCVIKNAIHGNNNAFSQYSHKYKLDKCKDMYSRIFANIPNNKGCGYYKVFIDPNRFDCLKNKSGKSEDDKHKNLDVLKFMSSI